MPVATMLREMPSAEITGWMAFFLNEHEEELRREQDRKATDAAEGATRRKRGGRG